MYEWLSKVPWLRLGAYLFLSTVVLGNLASYLRRRGLRDGYTRKINHFGHMVISTPLLAFLPPENLLPATAIGSVVVVFIYGVAAVSERPLVHGIVAGSLRDRDAPRSRFFFFLPLIAGNIGLVLAVFLFPLELVRVAFFTVAFGDGFAEPVGLRFGATTVYRVKDPIWRCYNTKSLHGSGAVAAWGTVIALATLAMLHPWSWLIVPTSLLYGVLVAFVEALSPRGLDNMLLFVLGPPILTSLTRLFI